MASNSTSALSGSGSGSSSNNDRINLIIAAIALVISVLAMFITTFQALQQYFSSATGQSSCSKKVIGKWSAFTELHFTTFRLEVRFRAPVLFVAPPDNEKGPLGETSASRIYYLDGSDKSLEETHTWSKVEFKSRETQEKESIRTADNELSTWMALMMAIQQMEKESRDWQKNKHLDYVQLQPDCRHTMAVGMQEKTRSWDTMPDGLLKPYATTTIAHFVEMMAMLGVHWKEFDRNDDKYRAQGNGFSVSGSLVPNLGIGFTFQKVGQTKFEGHRIVPNDSVKELCFGFCPTIFRGPPHYADEQDKWTLQLGTSAEVAETLGSFGCNTNTVNYFRAGSDHTRHSHLFPLPFEMLGMLGVVLQIKQTAFTMLPNPTFLTWDKSSFSLPMLFASFRRAFKRAMIEAPADSGVRLCPTQLEEILKGMDNVESTEKTDSANRREEKKQAAVAEARDSVRRPPTPFQAWAQYRRRASTFMHLAPLGNGRRASQEMRVVHTGRVDPFPLYLEALHSAIEMCDIFLTKPEIFPIVPQVFCLHFQEVLRYLNSQESTKDDTHAADNDKPQDARISTVPSSGVSQYADASLSDIHDGYVPLVKLDSASSSERHQLLADVYVNYIRKRIMKVPMPPLEFDSREAQDELNRLESSRTQSSVTAMYQPTMGDIDDIWRTLIFRMLCWLMLHDFHKKDVQISKSDVFDSRLPVYIL